jgi:hypothetical protein
MVFHLNDLECYFMSFHVMPNDFSWFHMISCF